MLSEADKTSQVTQCCVLFKKEAVGSPDETVSIIDAKIDWRKARQLVHDEKAVPTSGNTELATDARALSLLFNMKDLKPSRLLF